METNETETNNATRALVRPAVDGQAWAEWMPEIQNAGVDTLEFSFDVEIGQAMWERLEEEKEIAQMLMQTRKAEHVPDWLNAVVHPVGAKGGYRFLLETPTFSIKLLKGVPNRPPIYVEMRAYGLHTHEGGAIGACEAACTFIRETLLAEEDPEWTAKVINLKQFSIGLSRQGVASMGEPCDRIIWGDGVNRYPHGLPECLPSAGAQSAQDGLDLGECLFDRRKVGRVGRQEEELAVARFQGLANAGRLVDAQIIQHHDLSRSQRRRQLFRDVPHEGSRLHGPLNHPGHV